MPVRRSLLVAYLATPGGEDALAHGIELARVFDADLQLCIVLPPVGPAEQIAASGNTDYTEILDDQATAWLTAAIATVPDDLTAEGRIVYDENPAEGLVGEAERSGALAIVVGASGGGVMGRLSLGSTVNSLLHISSRPVVLTPRRADDATAADGTVLESSAPIQRVTCAVGRRTGAGPMMRTTLGVCKVTGLPLRLVSLVAADEQVSPWHQAERERAARHAAAEHLTDLLDEARHALGPDADITTVVVTARRTEDAVTSLEWRPGDILFVGSSRLAQPLHLFLGATAAKMLRALEVPMVVVPKDA
ncbi:MAG: universal stress protein [Gordonia sp. (in: high G+C Gram-positive bacteria)]